MAGSLLIPDLRFEFGLVFLDLLPRELCKLRVDVFVDLQQQREMEGLQKHLRYFPALFLPA